MTGEAIVDTAVILTDSSILPLAKVLMKLEILPPGQLATRSIPRHTIGVRIGFRIIIRRKVTRGRPIHWRMTPVRMDLGFTNTSLRVEALIFKAIPNMMRPSTMLITRPVPLPRFRLTASSDANCSRIPIVHYLNILSTALMALGRANTTTLSPS